MAFKIIWFDFAEMQLDQIFEYYIEKAGVRVAKNIIEKIILEPNKLLSHPEILQVEELLLDREKEYRYLICDNYKSFILSTQNKNI